MAAACTTQLARDAGPAWHKPLVICVPRLFEHVAGIDFVPRLVFFDTPDVANAAGYHDLGPDGLPYAKVFVGEILDGGGFTLTDSSDDGNSVSVCASHEALEILGDPSADDWRIGPPLPEGDQYALELSDPVQSQSYPIKTNWGLVSVSNFVTPAYFGGQVTDRQYDHLKQLPGPWTTAPGGYLIIRSRSGNVSNVFGSSKHIPHPASRFSWRQRGGIK